ncbi:hypothetical protein CAPTEDRAFT_210383, partial [Capitella teleta]
MWTAELLKAFCPTVSERQFQWERGLITSEDKTREKRSLLIRVRQSLATLGGDSTCDLSRSINLKLRKHQKQEENKQVWTTGEMITLQVVSAKAVEVDLAEVGLIVAQPQKEYQLTIECGVLEGVEEWLVR